MTFLVEMRIEMEIDHYLIKDNWNIPEKVEFIGFIYPVFYDILKWHLIMWQLERRVLYIWKEQQNHYVYYMYEFSSKQLLLQKLCNSLTHTCPNFKGFYIPKHGHCNFSRKLCGHCMQVKYHVITISTSLLNYWLWYWN